MDETKDFLDQILLSDTLAIQTAYQQLRPLLKKYYKGSEDFDECFPPVAERTEMQFCLLYAMTFVKEYESYVDKHCRPAIHGLKLFVRDAYESYLCGASKYYGQPCRSSEELAYPSYIDILYEAGVMWFSHWDPYGLWEKHHNSTKAVVSTPPQPSSSSSSSSSSSITHTASSVRM